MSACLAQSSLVSLGALWLAAGLWVGGVAGCASTQSATAPSTPALALSPSLPLLSDAEFAPAEQRLLRDGARSAERDRLLAQVVRYQLARAGVYFERHQDERGVAALSGAFAFIRAGELQPGLLAGSERTLLHAAAAVSRLGAEGRARALYELASAGPLLDSERSEILSHLNALDRWQTDTRDEDAIQAAGGACTVASERALVDRSSKNVADASDSASRWVRRALDLGMGGSEELQFDVEDQREARYAKIVGSRLIIALFLRDGDAAAARQALETDPFAAVPNEDLVEVLGRAASGEGEAWAELYSSFESWASAKDDAYSDIARGASWGAAVELYRLAPSSLRYAMPLTKLLIEQEAADVTPLILREALGEEPNPRDLAGALRLLHSALIGLDTTRDASVARLLFQNMQPLLSLAREAKYAPQTSKLVATLLSAMSELESADGAMPKARELLVSAVTLNPTASSLSGLASIAWQQGDRPAALRYSEQLRKLARTSGDVSSEMRGYVLAYDILREQGTTEEASVLLRAALVRVLELRSQSSSMSTAAAVERALASVLERYGEFEAAERATARAADNSGNDIRELTETLLDAQRRALTFADLAEGRAIIRRGLEAGLEDEDLVYLAVWQRLLERRLHARSDGSVEEALTHIRSGESWAGALRDWILGKLDNAQLAARASTANERIEAQFYAVLAQHFAAASEETRGGLKAVATSAGINLIEVRIARDLLALGGERPKSTLPPGTALP